MSFAVAPQLVQAQGDEQLLASADALYEQQKFVEAFNIYEKLFSKAKLYSPQMLTKMAFIREGTGDYANALYYLSVLYAQDPDPKIFAKISELAEKYKLQGYQPNDIEYLIYNFRYYLGAFLLAFTVLMLALLIFLFRIKRQGREVMYPCIAISVGLAMFFYIYNYELQRQKGIVKSDKVFLMNAPSAAGELVSMVEKGNCLPIVGKNDIWYKVRWAENDGFKEGYVRSTNLLIVD